MRTSFAFGVGTGKFCGTITLKFAGEPRHWVITAARIVSGAAARAKAKGASIAATPTVAATSSTKKTDEFEIDADDAARVSSGSPRLLASAQITARATRS